MWCGFGSTELPVVEPWAIPTTWGQLRLCCKAQGIDLDSLVEPIMPAISETERGMCCLLGFPIPARVQEPDVQVHWLALWLPALTSRPVKWISTNRVRLLESRPIAGIRR